MTAVLISSVDEALDPRMISDEAKLLYMARHNEPFPDRWGLVYVRHRAGLTETAKQLGMRRFLSDDYHYLLGDSDEIEAWSSPLSLVLVDSDYYVSIQDEGEELYIKDEMTWRNPNERCTNWNELSPVYSLQACKSLTKYDLVKLVAHNSHLVTRMNALSVLSDMPDDTTVEQRYEALHDLDMPDTGGKARSVTSLMIQFRVKRPNSEPVVEAEEVVVAREEVVVRED